MWLIFAAQFTEQLIDTACPQCSVAVAKVVLNARSLCSSFWQGCSSCLRWTPRCASSGAGLQLRLEGVAGRPVNNGPLTKDYRHAPPGSMGPQARMACKASRPGMTWSSATGADPKCSTEARQRQRGDDLGHKGRS